MKRGLVALAAMVLAVLMAGCASLDIAGRPEVRAVRPRITGIDFGGVDLAFDVDVNNPYPMAIRSPGFTRVTPFPVVSTSPAPSCPTVKGYSTTWLPILPET